MVKRERRRAFTLLEIVLAVAILGMMTMVIYRFVASNLTIMRVSTAENVADAIFFRAERARVQAIFHGAAEDEHADAKNRQAEEDLVERESPRQTFSVQHNLSLAAARSGPSILLSRRHWPHGTSPRPARSFLTARISIPRAAPPRLPPGARG